MSLLYGLIGLFVGSFLNTVIDRVPEGQSLLRPPSHCTGCGRRLSVLDMVPVLSYLLMRGRCRTCGARIPQRVLWVEVATGLLFVLLCRTYGLTLRLVVPTVYVCLMVVILVIDLERKLVLNVVVLPSIGIALLAISFGCTFLQCYPRYGFVWLVRGMGISLRSTSLSLSTLNMIGHVLGGVVGFLGLLFIRMLAPGGMGAGDVKLAAFVGLVTGFPGVIAAMLGAFILGGVVAAVLLLVRVANRKTPVPFAPFLVIGTFVVMLYGDQLFRWYVGL